LPASFSPRNLDYLTIVSKRSRGSLSQTLLYYLREFDVIGLSLFSVGLSLFLLSFNLYILQTAGWRSPMIIAFIVVGALLTIAAILWEIYGASVTCIPYQFFRNRTILGSALVSTVLFFSYYLWASYFSSFLLVVNGLDVQKATYVTNINSFGGAIVNVAVGWYISRVGRFKTVTLFFAIPLCMLGLGLMIYFRRADQHIGYIVMCQIFICCGSTIATLTTTLATMAGKLKPDYAIPRIRRPLIHFACLPVRLLIYQTAVSHQEIAIAIALISICSSIGGAIGSTASSTIWQNLFPKRLAEYLPVEELQNLPLIVGDITTQLSYPEGSAARIAIQRAYGSAQSVMVGTALASWAIGALGVVMWRDIDVKAAKQVVGRVA
jgi:hypothetical protein